MEVVIDSPKQGLGAEQLGFPVRRVPRDAPWDWLSRGWRDLCTVPTRERCLWRVLLHCGLDHLLRFEFPRGYVVNSRAGSRISIDCTTAGSGALRDEPSSRKGRADHSAQGLRRLCAGDRPAQNSSAWFCSWPSSRGSNLPSCCSHYSLVEGRFRLPASSCTLCSLRTPRVGLLFTGTLSVVRVFGTSERLI